MEITQAKRLVIRAGLEVVASGLIARTWGNISCRIDGRRFVITPSGRAYEDLTPDEIVPVGIDDLKYEGSVKPSSEKGVHAEAYRLRPEVSFIIHTHQTQASIVSTLGRDLGSVNEKSAKILGGGVPIAVYGLPGTGRLRREVARALRRSDSRAVIMANHGALCLGADYDEAFRVAAELEAVCTDRIRERYERLTGMTAQTPEEIIAYVGKKRIGNKLGNAPSFAACNSARDGGVFNLVEAKRGGKVVRIDIKTGRPLSGGECPASAELHRAIYEARKDVSFILHNSTPAELVMSRAGTTMKPLLDDFAQLIGVSVRCAVFDPDSARRSAKEVVRALRGRNAVLLGGSGALCVAGSEYDAAAVGMVMDKGCRAAVGAALFGGGAKPIRPLDAQVMRTVYLAKYSKRLRKASAEQGE